MQCHLNYYNKKNYKYLDVFVALKRIPSKLMFYVHFIKDMQKIKIIYS